MPYEASILQIDARTVLAACGPMRLTIRVHKDDGPCIDLASRAGYEALGLFERLAGLHRRLRRPFGQVAPGLNDPVAERMLESVRQVGDEDLTPMAAVAGTIAAEVADWIFERGAARVVVENGGDIAVRLAAGEEVNVGVRPAITRRRLSHRIHLDGRRSAWGIASSGLGGRSLTRGIASAATVLAGCASVADAAATAVANACYVPDPRIFQLPAEELDPATDLVGIPVTVGVGPLPRGVREAAVVRALEKAEQLSRRGVIVGALVALEGCCAASSGLQPYVEALNEEFIFTETA